MPSGMPKAGSSMSISSGVGWPLTGDSSRPAPCSALRWQDADEHPPLAGCLAHGECLVERPRLALRAVAVRVVVLDHHGAASRQPEAEPGLDAEGDEQRDVNLIERVVLDRRRPARSGVLDASLHLRQAIAVVDGGEELAVSLQHGARLERKVLREC